ALAEHIGHRRIDQVTQPNDRRSTDQIQHVLDGGRGHRREPGTITCVDRRRRNRETREALVDRFPASTPHIAMRALRYAAMAALVVAVGCSSSSSNHD